ncbi:MAG: fumarylacetoacetate hydrolase family protein [Propionibacteriaceae bacterium]|jgi:2-keto-4-pentenoate hydratase/2-oxohepta-3-ene-1,7-dioic acid hydratase in catechol pathway|uniref:Fumarylacetoacetate hydrolase family protein n=1 Tax=Brooklawnia propionicigenes TaxID=3041175 RepID=A0AAN0KBD2_9ACTN|nr:fumarylacetoacetate hydrolase family protein [Brooklawnia sp. SH051]MCB0883943.1 fumarylacetoacetate hydrolase family protein [Propionibacteriaceae bacterium]MEA5121183.1 fumarylacetoacetate hydrolase family protein [Propionibacterium sp.]NLI85727.1 fumarylacetoacetate hydrolase family protein [Propionibacterium sp.]BEH03322.1 fumarylacetoacetate hydrolase family protein [Brooklawnia sp. SH051]
MRIARFAVAGGDPRFGIVELEADEGQFPDTIAVIDGDPLAGPVNYTGERIALDDARLLAPVIPRSKILAVGKNYAAHAAEFDGEVPPEPLIFMKPNTSVIGPDDVIVRPQLSHNVHFEGELAVVIGRFCRKVPVERAAEVIFGYTVANDVTARDLQRSDGQWTRAKGFDTFCPLGPWIVTHLGIDEAADLSLVTSVDGEVKQDANTNQMVYSIAELIAYVSAFATLLPGDVLLTGTPAGVGPLLAGQRVSVEIDGIGTLTNPVVDDTDDLEDADSVAAK